MKLTQAQSDPETPFVTELPMIIRPGLEFSLEEPLNPHFDEVFISDGGLNRPQDDLEAWKPLVSLFAKFQHLSDLIYNCAGRFAPV